MMNIYKKNFSILVVMLILTISRAYGASNAVVADAVQVADQAVCSFNEQLVQLVQSISLVPLGSQVPALVTAMSTSTGVIALSTALNNAYVATGKIAPHPNANMLLVNFLRATDMVVKQLTQRFLSPVAPDTIQAAFTAATAIIPGVSPAVTTIQFLINALSTANNALTGNITAMQAAKAYYSAYSTHPDAIALQAGFLQVADTLVKQLTRRLTTPIAPDTAQAALLTAANDPAVGVTPLVTMLQLANAAVRNFTSPVNTPGATQAVRQIITTVYSTELEHPDAVALQVAFLQSAYNVVHWMTQQLNNPVAPMTLQSACAMAQDGATGAQAMIQILQVANNALTGNALALSKATAWYRTVIPHPAASLLSNALSRAQAALSNQISLAPPPAPVRAPEPVKAPTPVQPSAPVPVKAPTLAQPSVPVPVKAPTLAQPSTPAPVRSPVSVSVPVSSPTSAASQVSLTPSPSSVPASPVLPAASSNASAPGIAPVISPTPAPASASVVPSSVPVVSTAASDGDMALADALRTADQAVVNLTMQLTRSPDVTSQQHALNAANDPLIGATPAIAALQAANNALTGNQAAIALAGMLYNPAETHPDVTALTNAMIAVATSIQNSTARPSL